MAEAHGPSFSAEQAMNVQRALRRELGKDEEQFPLPAFVGMISDEIEDLRAAGRSDQDIVDIIARETGKTVSVQELAQHYAPPEARHWSDYE